MFAPVKEFSKYLLCSTKHLKNQTNYPNPTNSKSTFFIVTYRSPIFITYIFLLQMDLFLLEFMISAMTLILIFLKGDVPRRASYGVYISQQIRFARVFSARNKCLTAKLLQHGHRYHKIRKTFLNFIVDTMN